MVPVPYLVLLLQLGEVVVPLFQTLQDIQVVQAVVAVVLEEDQPVAVAELQVKVLPAADIEVVVQVLTPLLAGVVVEPAALVLMVLQAGVAVTAVRA
jgi:hypothetical protein